MKTRPHPYYDLYDEYPELRPGEDRDPLIVTVKRKARLSAAPRRGDVNFVVRCKCGEIGVNMDTRSAIPIIAAEYMQLLIRDLKPDEVIYEHSALEVEAILKNDKLP